MKRPPRPGPREDWSWDPLLNRWTEIAKLGPISDAISDFAEQRQLSSAQEENELDAD